MEKTYVANTVISLSVRLRSGVVKHVSFDGQTLGSSVFSTGDPELQWGLEHHHKFGSRFYLAPDYYQHPEPVEEVSEEEDDKHTVVPVSSLDDAKEYLADNFGMSRTKLRTKKAIDEAAQRNGVVFQYK